MITKTMQKTLLALSITAIISGCGSSSSSGGGGSASFDATIQGKAAKGIIISGDVVADELNADGTVKNPGVGSATTGSDGSYSLELGDDYEGGPVKITVSNNADTTTVCDATSGCGTRTDDVTDNSNPTTIEFGEQYKPASLSMSALLPDAEDGETIGVQVTPFTNMASEKAIGTGTLNSTSINAANSEVSDLLGGLDILRTEPVDITDLTGDEDAAAVAYAALTASIAELAPDDADGQPDIDQALVDLASDFSAGTFQADDMQDILDEATATLTETGAVDTSGLIEDIQDDVDDAIANNGGVIDPEPNPNAGDTDVELAKAFISDLRTWGTVINAEVEAPSAAFELQLDMADAVYDTMNGGIGEALNAGVDAAVDFADGLAELTDGDLTGYESIDATFTAGTITSNSTAEGVEYTIAGASATTVDSVDVTLDMVLIAPENGTVSTIVLGINPSRQKMI